MIDGIDQDGHVDGTIAELDRALRGPVRVKRGLLDETRAGLVDAVHAYRAAGVDRTEAARRAVADFGDVPEVAPAFQAELDVARLRRTAVAALVALPLLGWLCDVLWDLNPHQAQALPLVLPLIGLTAGVVAVAISVAGLAVLAATSRPAPYGVRAWGSLVFRVGGQVGVGTVAVGLAGLAATAPSLVLWPPFLATTVLSAAAFVLVSARHRRLGPVWPKSLPVS